MYKRLIASIVLGAAGLMAVAPMNKAAACEAAVGTGTCVTGPYVIGNLIEVAAAVGLPVLFVYLIANKDAPAGSLKAAAPTENELQFARNQRQAVPAYALIDVSPRNYNVATVPAK